MKKKRAEELIVKYLSNSLTREEWDELNAWMEKTDDTDTFYEYLKINYAADSIMNDFNTNRTKTTVLEKIKQDKSKVRRLNVYNVLKYAAVFVLLFGLGYFMQNEYSIFGKKQTVFPSDNGITLEMNDGSLKVLSEDESIEIVDANGNVIGEQKGDRLIYSSGDSQNEELVFNTLNIPYGKKFELQLSDGTVVNLNSGSSFRYPVNFKKDGQRNVFLEGEAFLDVAKDKSRPFVLNSNNLDVTVLGTQFNVSAYPEEVTTDVVLIEGAVKMQLANRVPSDENNNLILEPGYKGSFHRSNKNITSKPVNTSAYTSWMQGELVFRNMTFENILKKMERHYNVRIHNNNTQYSEKKFNANFGDATIYEVLDYFKTTYDIPYTIDDNEININ